MHIFLQKNVHSLITLCSHAHILSEKRKTRFSYAYIMSKNAHSLKNTIFSCHFFFISYEKHLCHVHIWLKTSIRSKLHFSMSKKSQKNALFSDSYAYILLINVLSLKNTMHSCLYYVNTAPFL